MTARTAWIMVLALSGMSAVCQTPSGASAAAVVLNGDSRPAARSPEAFSLASYDGWKWTVIDVQPATSLDTRVRFISAYPACGTYHVRETDYIFENTSV